MNIIKKLFSMKFHGFFSSPKVCSTRMISEQFYECRVKKPHPYYCEFSWSLGNGFICKHRDRTGFVGK
jgi:hypothetical protein